MVDVAMVRMFVLPVGTFRWDGQYEVVRFEYDRSFVGRGLEPSPLMMPVREGRIYSFAGLDRETFKGLPGMLADSLPDTYGRALFDKWLALTGRTSSNPIETLCFLGKRCMGALEFEPAVDQQLLTVSDPGYGGGGNADPQAPEFDFDGLLDEYERQNH